jgi:hypothetical protein
MWHVPGIVRHSDVYLATCLVFGVAALSSHQTPLVRQHEPVQDRPLEQQISAPVEVDKKNPSSAASTPPSFDLLRVEPNGEAVLAGRVEPGAIVTVLRNGENYAQSLADQSGAFTIVLPPLPVGASEIKLRSVRGDGSHVQSAAVVATVIARDRTTPPMVAVIASDSPTLVLSAGGSVDAGSEEPREAPSGLKPLAITSVDVQSTSGMFVSGHAPPGATVRLSLNGSSVAEGRPARDGRVTFSVRKGAQPGDYRVTLDEVDPLSGIVKSRAEVNFTLPGSISDQQSSDPKQADAVIVPQIQTTVVSRGDNLWSISRKAYGRGLQYTLVFSANRRIIRDPNRIYPKQVFVIPPHVAAARSQ